MEFVMGSLLIIYFFIIIQDGKGKKVLSYSWMNGWRYCVDFRFQNVNYRRCGNLFIQYAFCVKW